MSLIEANRLISFGLVVLIWLVQLVVYPAFAEIAADGFRSWHARYTRAITWVVAPLMLAQLVLAALLVVGRTNVATVAYAVLVVSTWLLTAFVSVPIHNALGASGHDAGRVRRLISTNWLRTVAWSVAFATLFLA